MSRNRRQRVFGFGPAHKDGVRQSKRATDAPRGGLFELTPLEQRILLSNGAYVLSFDTTSASGVHDSSSTDISVSSTHGSVTGATDHSGDGLGENTLYQPGSSSVIDSYYGGLQVGDTVTLSVSNLPAGHGVLQVHYKAFVLEDAAGDWGSLTTTDNATSKAETDLLTPGSAIYNPLTNTNFGGFTDINHDQLIGGSIHHDRSDYIYDSLHNFVDPASSATFSIALASYTAGGATGLVNGETWGIDEISVSWLKCSCQAGVSASASAAGPSDPSPGGLSAGTSWSSDGSGTLGGGATGNGTTNPQLPLLAEVGPDSFTVLGGGGGDSTFDFNGSSYYPREGGTETLTHDTTNHLFVYQASDGSETTFYDFDSHNASYLQGKAASVVDPGGVSASVTTFTYDSTTGQVTNIDRTTSAGTIHKKEDLGYTYSSGQVSSVQLQRKAWDTSTGGSEAGTSYQPVQSTACTYYGSGDPNGNPGDLETSTLEDASGSPVGVNYFRYYTSSGSGGYQGP